MTRINVIPPSELSDKHLVAEYRELPRLFRLIVNWQNRGEDGEIPESYRLGKGHVKFFYCRGGFLRKRHAALVKEMQRRNFTVNFMKPPAIMYLIKNRNMRDWVPTAEALKLNRQRIAERS